MNDQKTTYCGYVALLGRTNVGKSTLLNQLLGQKVSITADKPQTTRHRILGIQTHEQHQIVYVDTPGLHQTHQKQLNRYMNQVAKGVVEEVEVVGWVIEALKWQEDDEWILQTLKKIKAPVILLINKIDKVKNKDLLLPFIEEIQKKRDFAAIIPISASRNIQVKEFEKACLAYLPESPFFYPEDQLSDRGDRFICAEFIREKLFRFLGQELPYSTTVEINSFVQDERLTRIDATIWVERDGQKKIIIGEQGGMLKKIGTQARREIEQLVDQKVFLRLWVKVRENWTNDPRLMSQLGYQE